MSRDTELDKRSDEERPLPPRMLGDTDVRVILEHAEKLPVGASILEIGPWLGGLTRLLARHGQMTVVDHFVWTEANAANYPGIAAPAGSFRSVFEANMAAEGIALQIIETNLPQLDWPGGMLDFVVIDAPRTPEQLHGCLVAIASELKPGAKVLIKNALNTRDLGLGAYIDALLGLGALTMDATDQPTWCNIAVLTVTQEMHGLLNFDSAEELIPMSPMSEGFTDPWYGRSLSAFRIAHLGLIGRWADAYAQAAKIPANSDSLNLWDSIEPHLLGGIAAEAEPFAAVLSELVWLHNDESAAAQPPVKIGTSFTERLSAYWRNNAGAYWVSDLLEPALLFNEEADDVINQISAHSTQLFQNEVVEVGTGLQGGPLASLLAGSRRYTGLAAEANLDEIGAVWENFPTHSITADDASVIDALGTADVLIIGDGLEKGSPLEQAVYARTKALWKAATVIRI